MRYAYPYTLTPEPAPEGGFSVSFPDVPGARTQGDTAAEAAGRAEDALVSVLADMVDQGEAIPVPSPARGRPMAYVPMLEAAKLALHSAMLAERVSNVELGRRLGLDEKLVRRLRDPLHRSHIGQVEAALRVLGQRVAVDVVVGAGTRRLDDVLGLTAGVREVGRRLQENYGEAVLSEVAGEIVRHGNKPLRGAAVEETRRSGARAVAGASVSRRK